jgi:hypothetical protein
MKFRVDGCVALFECAIVCTLKKSEKILNLKKNPNLKKILT